MNRTILTIILLLLLATTARGSEQAPSTDRQLQEVIVTGGKHKQRSLTSRGAHVPGAVSTLTPDKVGCEIGTMLNTKHCFEVEEITFDIVSSNIEGATLSIQIYRDSTFAPLLLHPILLSIPEGKKQTITATPSERTLLEPGNYIVTITLADCDESVKQQWSNHEQWDSQTRYQMMKQSIQFPLYLRDGYMRSDATDAFERCTANIGVKVIARKMQRT